MTTTFVELYHPALPGVPHVRAATQAVPEYEARGWIRVDGSTPAPEAIYLTPGVGDLRYAPIGGGLTVATTVTASGALVAGKHNPVDATSAAKTMTLPTGTSGRFLAVEKIDATVNAVIVSGSLRGSASTISLVWAHETLLLASDSAGSWWPVSGHKTKATLDLAYTHADPVLSSFSYDATTGNLLSYQEDGITITLTYNADGTVATSKRGTATAKTYSYSGGNLAGVA